MQLTSRDAEQRRYRKQKRGALDIISDILRVSSQAATKTELVYGCNLNFTIINHYLEFMLENSFLFFNKSDNSYITTEQGKSYLKKYGELSELILTREGSFRNKVSEKSFLHS